MNYLVFLLVFGIAKAEVNSKEDPQLVERVYDIYCSSCHTKEEKIILFDKEKEDVDMIKTIRSGTSGMPTYSWLFTDDDLKKMIEYMRINLEK
jgi:mono/diheme cytochrome c family protein